MRSSAASLSWDRLAGTLTDREGGERRRRGARFATGNFWAMLKICSALRDNTKALLSANLASWAAGHGRGDK